MRRLALLLALLALLPALVAGGGDFPPQQQKVVVLQQPPAPEPSGPPWEAFAAAGTGLAGLAAIITALRRRQSRQ